MKVALILLALAYVHIGRGVPIPDHHEMDKPAKAPEPAAAPQADQAPQAAPAAEKPDICKVNVNGKEETLAPGDRYCKDETTNGVCGYAGETHEFPCDSGFKCHKHENEWKVTCLQINTNADTGIKYGEDGNGPRPVITIGGHKHDAQHDNAKAAPQSDSAPSQPAPANPAPAALESKHEEPASAPAKHEEPAPPPAPKHEEPLPPRPPTPFPALKPDEAVMPPKHEEPAPATVPKHEEPAPPPKPETCKATINGQEQTLQPGDRYCLTETTNRVCNWGEFVDYDCPSSSKCLKSPDKWQVLCRIVNKNQPEPGAPVPRRR